MKTGIQVSSLKPLLLSGDQVTGAFRKVAALGCEYVQLQWIDPSVPVDHIAAACVQAGLKSLSVQDFYQVVLENFEYYVNLNHKTGGTWLCVSRIPQRLKSPSGLEAFARELTAMGEKLAPWGQRLCFHPVSADFAPIGGIQPVEFLLERLPWLEICADLYHLEKCRADMPGWLRRYRGRVCMVHFKEGRGEKLVPAGQGDIDWTGVVPACLETGVPYAFVEQETWDRDPYECLGEALVWLRRQIGE